MTELPSDIILCSVYVDGLYPNTAHDEGLSALQERERETERERDRERETEREREREREREK